MTDAADTPTLTLNTPQAKAPVTGIKARTTAVLDTAGQPFIRPAAVWKKSATARAEQRNPENLAALREAGKAHQAAMKDLRRDRRAFERARSEVKWWNVVNGERRAARAVVRETRRDVRDASRARREARKAYPLTLPALAVRCHAAHLIPSAGWQVISDSTASATVLALSVAAVAVSTAGVALGLRHVRNIAAPVAAPVAVDPATEALEALQPSQDERDLLQRLDPTAWHTVAQPRGLSDVVSAGATLTESGIQAKLTLNGTMDLAKLRGMQAQFRAALRLKEDVRLELREGASGGHARMTLRTRSAAAGLDMAGWKPGDVWAVNTVTGETVPVPLGKRVLFAGGSGAGKSWSARPLMAEASEHEDHRLVIFDRKTIEGLNWNHRARVASELDDMRELCEELIAEGEARMKLIPRGRDVIEISATTPRITVFVDEGGELIADAKTKHPKDEDGRGNYDDIMTAMRTMARKYRAAEIILVWCTQKPALSGEGHGLDSQIAGQMGHRLSLALATSTDSQVVFGNDAIEKGWKAHELPRPGFALFRDQDLGPKSVPQMLKMRAMSPKDVIGLPARPVWSRSSGRATSGDVAARKALEGAGRAAEAVPSDPWAGVTITAQDDARGPDTDSAPTLVMSGSGTALVRVPAADRDDQIMTALRKDPCVTLSALARSTGLNKATVKRSLDRMAVDGLVARDANGCWAPID